MIIELYYESVSKCAIAHIPQNHAYCTHMHACINIIFCLVVVD